MAASSYRRSPIANSSVAAAAFRRAGVVWLVFDRPTRFDLTAVAASQNQALGEVSQVFHETASILQFTGDNVATPRLVADGAAWTVDFRPQAEGPLAEIEQQTDLAGGAGGRLLFSIPNPSQPVDLDYPTLGRLVETEAEDLYESAETVNDELKQLTRDQDWVPAATIIDHELEVPRSPDELIARLNGIGQSAYRLARHVRTLVEFRALHVARRAETESGI